MTYIDKEGEWRNKKVTVYEAVGSLISQLRDAPDITRVSMPSVFCHPYSLTEMEGYRMLRKVDLLLEAKKLKDPVERMLKVTFWLLSIIHSPDFQKKPYNPVLGETLGMWVNEEDDEKNQTIYFSEQVSHHPPILVSALENKSEGIRGEFYVNFGAKFHGNSASIESNGKRTIVFSNVGNTSNTSSSNNTSSNTNNTSENNGESQIENNNSNSTSTTSDNSNSTTKGEKEDANEQVFRDYNSFLKERKEEGEKQTKEEKKYKIEEMEGEKYYFTNFIPTLWMKNVLIGTRRHNWEGTIEIKCPNTNLVCLVSWKESQEGSFFSPIYKNLVQISLYQFNDSSSFSSSPHSPLSTSFLSDSKPTLLKDLRGEAGQDIFFYENNQKGELAFSPESYKHRIMQVLPKEKRIPSSSLEIWGKLSDAISVHDLKIADKLKREVEQEQRELRKQREINKTPFSPSFFEFKEKENNWLYKFDDLFIPIRSEQENN